MPFYSKYNVAIFVCFQAKRSVAFKKLPDVLTLALNRFVFNLHTLQREKCNDRFEFPLIIDFEPFLDEKLKAEQTHRTDHDLQQLNAEYDRYRDEQRQKEKAKKQREQDRKQKEQREIERKQRAEREKKKRAERYCAVLFCAVLCAHCAILGKMLKIK